MIVSRKKFGFTELGKEVLHYCVDEDIALSEFAEVCGITIRDLTVCVRDYMHDLTYQRKYRSIPERCVPIIEAKLKELKNGKA